MKRSMSILVLILALALVISGCGSNKGLEVGNIVENKDFLDSGYVASVDWLKENLEKENLLILDARGAETYNKSHIPGAIAITWQEFSDMSGAPGENLNWGTVLEVEALSQELSKFGITKDKEVVVYTNTENGWGEDGRIVWMLRMAGYDNSKILDGGFNYWTSKGYEVSKDVVEPIASIVEIESLDRKVNIDTEELVNNLDNIVVIDTREKDEYKGATKYGEVRGGHIPGAINISFDQFLNKNGTLKSTEEIQSILEDNGIKKDDEIATYCTAGIRSAHMQIVLTMMGYDNARNYDASIHAWAGSASLEMDK